MQGFWYSAYTHTSLTCDFCAHLYRHQDDTAEVLQQGTTRLHPTEAEQQRTEVYFVWLEEVFPVWATTKARSSARKIETLLGVRQVYFYCVSVRSVYVDLFDLALFLGHSGHPQKPSQEFTAESM